MYPEINSAFLFPSNFQLRNLILSPSFLDLDIGLVGQKRACVHVKVKIKKDKIWKLIFRLIGRTQDSNQEKIEVYLFYIHYLEAISRYINHLVY